MNQPWQPEILVSEKEAEIIIGNQFPELIPVTVKAFGAGFDNSVFLVNNQYVFRFPRREIAANLIQIENRLLPFIASSLPIPVPNPQFLGIPDDQYPWTYGGYGILSGRPPEKLTDHQRMQSVEPLAHFLRTLHDFPLADAKKLKIPNDQLGRIDISKRKPILVANLQSAREKGLIDPQSIEQLERFLATIMKPLEDGIKTLVHGDIHIRNLLVNKNGKVSGIIDWGDTHIGHPAIDLSVVYSFLPAEGRDAFFKIYGEVHPETKKLARFKAIYTIILLLLFAADQQENELVNECLAALCLALQD